MNKSKIKNSLLQYKDWWLINDTYYEVNEKYRIDINVHKKNKGIRRRLVTSVVLGCLAVGGVGAGAGYIIKQAIDKGDDKPKEEPQPEIIGGDFATISIGKKTEDGTWYEIVLTEEASKYKSIDKIDNVYIGDYELTGGEYLYVYDTTTRSWSLFIFKEVRNAHEGAVKVKLDFQDWKHFVVSVNRNIDKDDKTGRNIVVEPYIGKVKDPTVNYYVGIDSASTKKITIDALGKNVYAYTDTDRQFGEALMYIEPSDPSLGFESVPIYLEVASYDCFDPDKLAEGVVTASEEINGDIVIPSNYYPNTDSDKSVKITKLKDYGFQQGITNLKSLKISNSIKSIGQHFASSRLTSSSEITSITIPNNVDSIGIFAFCGNETDISNINKLILSDGGDNLEIKQGAFKNLSNIKQINIPSRLKSLGYEAFSGNKFTDIYIDSDNIAKLIDIDYPTGLYENNPTVYLNKNINIEGVTCYINTHYKKDESTLGDDYVKYDFVS